MPQLTRLTSSLTFCLAIALAGCAYNSSELQHAPGSEVGGVGSIQFDHRQLSGGMHTITVHARPGLAETETSISQRIIAFGTKFAADTCKSGFDFVNNPDPDRPVSDGFAQRTKTYTFRCR